MGTIRIEAIPVQSYFLGLFGFDHLQIVYQDETSFIDSQDYWYVIEGVVDSGLAGATLGVNGASGTLSLGVSNDAGHEALVDKIGTPEQRGSRIVYSGAYAETLWSQMAAKAGAIEDQAFPYIAYSLPFSVTPTINSTSLVASVLWAAGIDLGNLMPFNVGLSPGGSTLLGTGAGETLTVEASFTTLVAGGGDDSLFGSTNTFYLDKLYGGSGDDTFTWSFGDNLLHGGQPLLAYELDGRDTVDYSGVGHAHIVAMDYAIDHKIPEFFVSFDGGSDQWFSIEEITWNDQSDVITGGENIEIIRKPMRLDLQGNASGQGDVIDFSDSTTDLVINSAGSGFTSIQTVANSGQDAGYWASSAEWVIASQGDDKIYSAPDTLGVEGGSGDDIIDTRLAVPGSGASPLGYDVEIYGDDGDDTVVVGSGRSYIEGGDGEDRFVLSTMSGEDGSVEVVIVAADAEDKLYIPYDLFKEARGNYEGSELFQVSGGVFAMTDVDPTTDFLWGAFGEDMAQGTIEFVGHIQYEMSGSDLLISIFQGVTAEVDYGTDEEPNVINTVFFDDTTRATVRVVGWSEGMLGITFPLVYDGDILNDAGSYENYPGLMARIADQTSAARFIDGLDERPDPYIPLEIASTLTGGPTTLRTLDAAALAATGTGSDGADVLVAAPGEIAMLNGGGGDDTLIGGAGSDVLIGGGGADSMAGGRGNDTYFVDDAGDVVIEYANEGFDKVYASIDHTLGAFVEDGVLEGTAIALTGNAFDNRLLGNAEDNIISGGDGKDTLAGDLGDDILIGGEGGDGYVYALGDGHDTIIETGTTGDDYIVLAGGLTFADVVYVRTPAHDNDLVFVFSDGGTLTVVDYYAVVGGNIEGIALATGQKLDGLAFTQAAQAALTSFNFAPVANPDSYVFEGGNSITLPAAALLDNDLDPEGDTLTITAIANVSGGIAYLDGDGNVVVTRESNGGTVRFDYAISDGHGGTAQSTFEIAMHENGAPEIVSASLGDVTEGESALGQLFASDPDGDTLIFAIKDGAGPSQGTVTFGDDGVFTYTPDSGAHGGESFIVTVSDGFHDATEAAFSFDIPASNRAPVAHDDAGYSVTSGSAVAIAAADLLGNDSDADGDALAITAVSNAVGGSVALADDGTILFTADGGFSGAASFSYSVSDGNGGSAQATVSIDVNAPPAGGSIIQGTPGRDVLSGTAGDDIFYGNGDRDTFVFGSANGAGNGDDVIKDFDPGFWFLRKGDVLDLRESGLDGYIDLIRHIEWDGWDTVIDLPDGGSVRLEGVIPLQLQPDNFLLF